MNQGNKSKPAARDDDPADVDLTNARTPSTGMQPEDTGTPESGNTDSGSEAGGAAKRTGKTPAERGQQ